MDRRNFLAIIPSLSAIPFIGKDIVQKSDRIEIFSPEEMQQEIAKPSYCEMHIVSNNRVLGKGYLTNFTVDSPIDKPSHIQFISTLSTPLTEDLWDAVHNINNHTMRP
jgi:hypothetical protein